METIRTICQFCHTNCGLLVHCKDDGTFSVEGDPDHPMNRGRICSKATAIPEILTSKDRLRTPLIKTPSGHKAVSWGEALDFAADKLSDIRERFGPASLSRCVGAPVSYECRDGFLNFMGAFGSPNMTGSGSICMVPRMTAFRWVTGAIRPEPDYDSTRLALFWGADPTVSERFSAYAAYDGLGKILPNLRKRGARIICIDPFHTRMAKAADQWIRINPGTDTALGLAMIHVIIGEKLFDADFVAAHTRGFDDLAEHVREFTPAWAEPITGVPEADIRELARLYATTGPATIHEGNGLDMHTNGVDAVRTIAILIALTGNLDAPGGNVFMPFAQQSSLPANPAPIANRIGAAQYPLFPEIPFSAVKESILHDDPDRPHAMIVQHSNPVVIHANEQRTRQALEALDFLMVCDIFPTATTEVADLVLPMTSDFEDYGYRAYASTDGGFLALARPITDRIGEARSVFEAEYALAERLDLHEDYPFKDAVSWIDYMLRPTGADFARLDAEQIVHVTPPIQYRKYLNDGFNTASGKVELYSRPFEKNGRNPMPVFVEPEGGLHHRGRLANEGYPLLGTSKRPAQFVHSKFKNLAATTRSHPEPLVWIHPEDAARRTIENGDDVTVASPRGTIALKAKLTDDTAPGWVWIDFGWGNATDGKASINILVDDRLTDPVSGGTPNRYFHCDVLKENAS